RAICGYYTGQPLFALPSTRSIHRLYCIKSILGLSGTSGSSMPPIAYVFLFRGWQRVCPSYLTRCDISMSSAPTCMMLPGLCSPSESCSIAARCPAGQQRLQLRLDAQRLPGCESESHRERAPL
ncbi:unnamed protein product, partial [Ectocarpus sp. 12 AP-2014]